MIDTAMSTAAFPQPPLANAIQISKQIGSTSTGIFPSDYESQIHLALLNLRKALLAARSSVADLAKLTLYVVDWDDNKRLEDRHVEKFLGNSGAITAVVKVKALGDPKSLVEVEAVVHASATTTVNGAGMNGAETSSIVDQPHEDTGEAQKEDRYDVIVIGAGLSGLAAARDVVKAGLSCSVLEARDRVGGKTWSRSLSGGGVIELGAAWINDTNQSRMIALAREIGAELIEQNTSGDCMFQDHDGVCSSFPYGGLPMFDPTIQESVASMRDLCEAECQKLDSFDPQHPELDSVTFEAFLEKSGTSATAKSIAAIWTRAMLGQEPRDVSALFFLNYCKAGGGLLQMRSDRKNGGQYLRIRKGTQSFSEMLIATLPEGSVHTSTRVLAVKQENNDWIEITTDRGTFHAKKVISSIPGPCMNDITFVPPRPGSTTVLNQSMNYGYYTKVMMVFRTPFWVERGLCGLAQSFPGPACVVRDTSSPQDNKWILTCFLAGDPGRSWSLLAADERRDILLEQIGQLFADGKDVRDQYIEHFGHEWSGEQFSGWGCPCTALAPGVLSGNGKSLGTPFGNIHVVGTETAGVWKGFMEGAVRSGERGAAEVIQELKCIHPSA